jgi:hypothetical protein
MTVIKFIQNVLKISWLFATQNIKKYLLIFSSISLSLISISAISANVISESVISKVDTDSATSSIERALNGSRTLLLTFEQLGLIGNMKLAGFDGRNGLNFNARSDEVIVSSTLKLKYKYSPELLSELSSINIYVNGQSLTNIEIVKGSGNASLEKIIPIPTQLIAEKNTVTFQLVGHYAEKCEDPSNPGLWAQISSDSQLEIITIPIYLPNNLAHLPAPFFDSNDSNKLILPFILPNAPSNKLLESASVLSSWFSSLAGDRGSIFPVYVNNIPDKGNAILLALGQPVIAGIDIAAPTGPTIAIVKNPKDPLGKLLIIMGKDSNELKLAVSALVMQSQKLAGESVNITKFAKINLRKPYDAPKWIASDKPVKLGSLVNANALTVKGSGQQIIQVDVPVPPSLYSFDKSGLPINLKYAYTNQYVPTKSSLLINFNGEFVHSLSLSSVSHFLSRINLQDAWYSRFIGLARTPSGLLSKSDDVFIPMSVVYPSSNVELDFDKKTYFQGDVFRIKGHRIDFDKVQKKIFDRLSESIKDILLVGHGSGDEARLIAYLVPKSGGQLLDRNALHAMLLEVLPEYNVPSYFVILDALPLTPEGDVDRSQLPQPAIISKKISIASPKLQLIYQFKGATKVRAKSKPVTAGECPQIIVNDELEGTINPNSTIDLSGLSHFSAMPNLGAFQSSGFPYTRYADLSETAIVLGDHPNATEYSALLNLVGHLARSTGYPGTLVTVVHQKEIAKVADKDLLILASGGEGYLPKDWASHLPKFPDYSEKWHFNSIASIGVDIKDFFTREDAEKSHSVLALFEDKNNALIAGFQSPLNDGRSVVLLWGGNSSLLNDMVGAVQGDEIYYGNVLGSLSMLTNKQVIPLISDHTYFVGNLPWYEYIQWLMSRHIMIFLLTSLLGALLMTLLVYYVLKTKQNKRLGKS